MKISEVKLDWILENTKLTFEKYKREEDLSKNQINIVIRCVFGSDKEIKWLNNLYDIKDAVRKSQKPWAYHYSNNFNWVIAFIHFYEIGSPDFSEQERSEMSNIYVKCLYLKILFDHVDGVIEDDDTIYVFKDDINLIKTKINKIYLELDRYSRL